MELNNYLHPDFDEIDIVNITKKPSPLALLAETCKNIGSVKSNRTFHDYEKHCSPNGLKKSFKRCRSDSSSISSSVDKDYLSKIKKIKFENTESSPGKSTELKTDDISSETSFNSNNALMANLLKFLKSSSSELTDSSKFELLQFISTQMPEKSENIKSTKKINRENHFNVINGFHLDSDKNIPRRNSFNSKVTAPLLDVDQSKAITEQYGGKSSAIKYCMYCGMLIPVLPMLLTHIRLEHNVPGFSGFDVNGAYNYPMSTVFDAYKPYPRSSHNKSDSSLLFLTDYINSSFMGLSNLIC